MTSQTKTESNRQNAQHSTGPTSAAGRQKSSINSVKHGLTGHAIMVAPGEEEAYRQLVADHEAELKPVGGLETCLVHAIANNRWRLAKIASLESAVYALGLVQHADKVKGESPENAAAFCRLLTLREDQKELDRLHRYECRLLRTIRIDMQDLFDLQTQRQDHEAQQEKDAAAFDAHFTAAGETWNPADFGFVLSIEEIRQIEARKAFRNRVCNAKTDVPASDRAARAA